MDQTGDMVVHGRSCRFGIMRGNRVDDPLVVDMDFTADFAPDRFQHRRQLMILAD